MNRIQQFTNAARQLAETMTPGLRVVALLLVVTIAVSFAALFQSGVSTTRFLFDGRGFTEAELQRIEIAFAKANLNEHEIVGRRIRVPAKRYSVYVSAFDDSGVKDPHGSHVAEQMNKQRFFESNGQTENRIRHADEQDLARNIRMLPGIIDAKVRVNIRRNGGLQQSVTASAGVNVRCESEDVLNADMAQTIRMIVAAYDPALAAEDVDVIDLTYGRKYPAGYETGLAESRNDPTSQKREIENYWQQKLSATNLQSYGVEHIVVNCSDEAIQGTSERRLRVFADVPTSYYYKSWQSLNQFSKRTRRGTPSADDLKVLREKNELKIERVIQGICGNAVVTIATFNDAIVGEPDVGWRFANVHGWLSKSWPLIAGMGALCFFVWNVRAGLQPRRHFPSLRQDAQPQSVEHETIDRTANTNSETIDLRERLSAVVRNDPDAAAQVLQDWMKEAS